MGHTTVFLLLVASLSYGRAYEVFEHELKPGTKGYKQLVESRHTLLGTPTVASFNTYCKHSLIVDKVYVEVHGEYASAKIQEGGPGCCGIAILIEPKIESSVSVIVTVYGRWKGRRESLMGSEIHFREIKTNELSSTGDNVALRRYQKKGC